MHGLGVVHLDLNLENIVCKDNFDVKVSGFGIATNENIGRLTLERGTP